MTHIYRWKIPPFDFTFILVIAKDVYEERRRRRWNIFGEPVEENYRALFCDSQTGKFVIFLQGDQLTFSTIAHEVYHLVTAVLAYAVIPLHADNDEIGAYLTSWFISRIATKIKIKLK